MKDSLWLEKLLTLHTNGITAYDVVDNDPQLVRADGYCLLIDRELYQEYSLDETYGWWWSVTKLQGEVLRAGFPVVAIKNHGDIVYSYGGKSGSGGLGADDRNLCQPDTSSWFGGRKVQVVDHVGWGARR